MNKISINFTLCSPEPLHGYKIYYRVAGSGDDYKLAGTFFTSPAVFYDNLNPAGTCYEGYMASDCGDLMGNHIAFETCNSTVIDNSSCGTTIAINTADMGYVNLGFFDLHIDSVAHVSLNWATYERPDRFTVFKDGSYLTGTGWKGYAPYPGPWGMSLSTTETGSLTFNPLPGSAYKIQIEVGPAGPAPFNLTDNFVLDIICS